MYKVSILVPVYGVEKYIERCARSLFEQSYTNIEYIFVDDCSKDLSIQKLKKIILDYPQRENNIRIIKHSRNCGLAEARNTGILAATGDFVIHVDADDYVDCCLVQKAVESQLQFDSDVVIWDYYIDYGFVSKTIKQKERSNPHKRVLSLLKKNDMPCVWCNMIKRSLYIDNSIMNEEGIDYSEDFQVVPKLIYYADKISYINDPLYYYNCSNVGSYTNTLNSKKMEQLFRTIDILKDFFKEKGKLFVDAIEYSEIFSLSQYMNVIIKQENHDYYFLELHKRWDSIDPNIRKYLPIWRRALFILPDNFLLKGYVCLGKNVNRLYNYLDQRFLK